MLLWIGVIKQLAIALQHVSLLSDGQPSFGHKAIRDLPMCTCQMLSAVCMMVLNKCCTGQRKHVPLVQGPARGMFR